MLINRKNVTVSFLSALDLILVRTKETEEIFLEEIIAILGGKGYSALLILFSLPLCFPVTLPGLSFFIGVLLGFIGLRISFSRRLWWPNWLLRKKFTSATIEKITLKTRSVVLKLGPIFHPRLTVLTQNGVLLSIHGLLIFALSFLLALPLPIPLTNMLTAIPILLIGFGLLEDDGLLIILAYLFAVVCFLFFFALYVFGKEQLSLLF